MQIWRSLDEIPDDLGPTAVVIGNFDGVHLGHRQVLAREADAPAAAGVMPISAGNACAMTR